MTDAVKEEFIKIVGVMPSGKNKTATEIAKLQSNYEAMLEGFRLARSNGVPASDIADKIIAEYKEHYDFPSQGESHMHDWITSVLDGVPVGEADRRDTLYMELLLAVGKKYPGESRHETALRYIRNAEGATSDDDRAAIAQQKETDS